MRGMDASDTAQSSPTQALLKRLRARGLTQTEIARRTQISQPKLSRWENGFVADGADDAMKLQALEIELAEADRKAA